MVLWHRLLEPDCWSNLEHNQHKRSKHLGRPNNFQSFAVQKCIWTKHSKTQGLEIERCFQTVEGDFWQMNQGILWICQQTWKKDKIENNSVRDFSEPRLIRFLHFLIPTYVRYAAASCSIAMCGRKLQCACRTHFGSDLRCACVRCIFRLAECDHNIVNFCQWWNNWQLKFAFFWCKLLFCSSKMEDFNNFSKKSIFRKLIGRI